MYDVIIIGKGPAGLSASLYTSRANLKTLIIGKDDGSLSKAERIENYFGFSGSVSGAHLLKESEKQALRFGVDILEDETVGIEKENHYKVITSEGQYFSKAVLIATGQAQKKIDIQNLKDLEGRGVSYCTTCDGFFYKNLKVGVLGFKDYAIHEAKELLAFTNDITIFTNGEKLSLKEANIDELGKFKVIDKRIKRLDGKDFLEKVVFSDESEQELDGFFIAYESATSTDFARKLGVITEDNAIVVDKNQQTNLAGLFAAGDCTGGFKQIATAVGQGALAGKRIIEYVREIKDIVV